MAIESNESAAVVVKPISIATLLVGVQIHAPKLRLGANPIIWSDKSVNNHNYLKSGFLDELYPTVQLTKFMMAAA